MSSFYIVNGTINQNSATTGYSASGLGLPSTSIIPVNYDENGQMTQYYALTYSDLRYQLFFSDGTSFQGTSGTKTFYNLAAGSKNTVSLQIVEYCTQTTTFWALLYDANDNPTWQSSFISQGSHQVSATQNLYLTIYTSGNDGSFPGYIFKKNEYIHTQLTLDLITQWCKACDTKQSFLTQSDQSGYAINKGCLPSSKDLITADWFNLCVEAAQAKNIPKVISNKTKITTEIFYDLGQSVIDY